MSKVKGCHLVGSVCLPDAEAVFRQCSAGMPNRLKRIPDGETASRQQFTLFQMAFFQAAPEMLLQFVNNVGLVNSSFTPEEVSTGIEKLKQARPRTGYEDVALESYKTFKKLRDEEGAIPKGTRFQVSLPSHANVIILVQKDFQKAAEPVYEEALFDSMREIQKQIPHHDLSIQIDLAVDTMFWENLDMYRPWFYNDDSELVERKQYIVDYVVRMIAQVDEDVEVGIHNCYGDMEHRHWKEPGSLQVITERGLAIFNQSPRSINYFHVPVPLSAMDKLDSYFAPLTELIPKFKEHGTELYLGLVHNDDLEGTQSRIDAARKAFEGFEFGVATECGWGRTPEAEIESIMAISSRVSEPVM